MHHDEFEIVEPRADALIESLRAFGYSPQTAIADLIDNSVSAKSSNIDVHFRWDGPASWIAILDDGVGMSEEVLREAMRAGSSNPLDSRDAQDLGRFGLGLKTASFSQCRRLIVMSAIEARPPTTRTWDIDLVGATGQWRLLAEEWLEDTRLWRDINPSGRGTLVIWRNLDRIIDPGTSANELTERHFYAVANRVVEHLSMIFHRFLRGPSRLSLRVNGKSLKPWDPFLETSPATQPLGDEALIYRGARIRIRSFVLPDIMRLSHAEYGAAGGPRGWSAHQGFYVYRNRRLIVSGDWLGLGFGRDESTKLARIQLDLPNYMDQDWQLDVRKSVARPPAALAPQLRRIAEVARRGSAQVHWHRGKVIERSAGGNIAHTWEQTVRGGSIAYRINRQHPVVEALLRHRGDGHLFEALLRLIEETVPVPLIVMDHASGESRMAAPFEDAEAGVMNKVIQELAKALQESGLKPGEVINRLSHMEPFCEHPELIVDILSRGTK